MNSLVPISSTTFKENVSIRFNNILDGFKLFSNFEINGQLQGENALIDFLYEVFEINDNEVYIDLYLNNLNENDKNNLLEMCCAEDKEIIHNIMSLNHDDPYYKITAKELIPVITRLNTREVFFVTLYFTKTPITIWGNYNMTFPCFVDNTDNLKYYQKLAAKTLN